MDCKSEPSLQQNDSNAINKSARFGAPTSSEDGSISIVPVSKLTSEDGNLTPSTVLKHVQRNIKEVKVPAEPEIDELLSDAS
jgi:hypothetical protein